MKWYKLRKIDDSIKKIIISVLNCQETDAIYIFGSYGTKYFTEESDIDIAWFTSSHIDLVIRGKFEKFFKLFRVCCRALTSRWKIVIIKTTAFAVVFIIV